MEIRVLKYFLLVAREENITKAANLLHLTQPTLSRQLMQLEEELGVQLFRRSKHRIILTEEGMLLRRRAEEIVSLADKTKDDLQHREDQLTGTIAVGSGELQSSSFLTRLLTAFQGQNPLVRFAIYSGNSDNIKERIERGLLDVGLLQEPVDISKYSFVRTPCREQWGVLVRADSELAAKDSLSPEELAGVPLIMPRRPSIQGEIANWFGDYYDKIQVLFTSNLPASSAVMANQGLAYSINTCGSVDFWDQTKLTHRPLKPELVSTCALAWKRQQPFGTAAEKFISHIRKCLTEKEIQEKKNS